MAKTKPTRIAIRVNEGAVQEEKLAHAAITPGHLIEFHASNGKFQKQATAGARCLPRFALEDALQGKTIADAYAAGDRVPSIVAQRGDIIYAWLKANEDAEEGEKLTPDGSGMLKVATGSDVAIAEAAEAVDATDSNDVNERIKVRIL